MLGKSEKSGFKQRFQRQNDFQFIEHWKEGLACPRLVVQRLS